MTGLAGSTEERADELYSSADPAIWLPPLAELGEQRPSGGCSFGSELSSSACALPFPPRDMMTGLSPSADSLWMPSVSSSQGGRAPSCSTSSVGEDSPWLQRPVHSPAIGAPTSAAPESLGTMAQDQQGLQQQMNVMQLLSMLNVSQAGVPAAAEQVSGNEKPPSHVTLEQHLYLQHQLRQAQQQVAAAQAQQSLEAHLQAQMRAQLQAHLASQQVLPPQSIPYPQQQPQSAMPPPGATVPPLGANMPSNIQPFTPDQLALMASLLPGASQGASSSNSVNELLLRMIQTHMQQQQQMLHQMERPPPAIPSSSASVASWDSNHSGASSSASQSSTALSSHSSVHSQNVFAPPLVPGLPADPLQRYMSLPQLPSVGAAGLGGAGIDLAGIRANIPLAQLPLAQLSQASLFDAVQASYLLASIQASQRQPQNMSALPPDFAAAASKCDGDQQHNFGSFSSRSSVASRGSRASTLDDSSQGRRQRRNTEDENEKRNAQNNRKVDLSLVLSGEDQRSTLMLRNIPNKYSQRMLLNVIEVNHKGKFDLLYLPIDSKNRCNVGYAFINFTSYRHVPAFYEEFRGKKWDRFNSDKIAQINYARIQGKETLIAHFSNSSLADQDESMQPAIFSSDGRGIREPFCRPPGAVPRNEPRGEARDGTPPKRDHSSRDHGHREQGQRDHGFRDRSNRDHGHGHRDGRSSHRDHLHRDARSAAQREHRENGLFSSSPAFRDVNSQQQEAPSHCEAPSREPPIGTDPSRNTA